ncbi:MAG: outer membrane lipoprotein-sorting protein [Proteobacteria bacterium]|nr:outer membrane lipoprotein-sorting protein [Pseudomonadota bacterium]MCK4487184.1 outer membrane lipoprotein-sorting protein [Desulfobacterales bacterium]
MKISILAILIAFASSAAFAEELSVLEIMERNYQVNRTRDRCNEVTMEMYSKHGKKRVRKLKTTALLMKDGVNEKRLLRFLYPPDIKGTGFLVIEHSEGDDDMWLYLPTLRKSRRKLASNKKDSFLGTEFSYGDIVGPKVEEYEYRQMGEEQIDGISCYVIEAVPASKDILRDYGYSKRINYIKTDNFTTVKAIFFDKYGKPLKTLSCFDPVEVDSENHKWFIKRREMVNHKNGRRTILELEKIQINIGIKEDLFTVRYLERGI